jgi:hypothetical protein
MLIFLVCRSAMRRVRGCHEHGHRESRFRGQKRFEQHRGQESEILTLIGQYCGFVFDESMTYPTC